MLANVIMNTYWQHTIKSEYTYRVSLDSFSQHKGHTFQHFVNFRLAQYLEKLGAFKTRLFAACFVSAARITLVRAAPAAVVGKIYVGLNHFDVKPDVQQSDVPFSRPDR